MRTFFALLACAAVAMAANDVNVTATSDAWSTVVKGSTCPDPGDCGRAYQACCVAFQLKGYPCGCSLAPGQGASGPSCGDCGTAYAACCVGFQAKGYPCTCDVEPSS